MCQFAEGGNEDIVFERFFTVNLDLLCIADLEGNFIKVNTAWEQVLGYSVQELEKRKFLDFIHPEDMEATLNAIEMIRQNKQVINFINRYCSKDGSYRYIEWKSQPYGEFIYAAARDITERVKLEVEMESQKRLLKALLDAIPDVIFYKDTSSKYIGCNRAFAEKFVGVDEEEIKDKTDFDFFSDTKRANRNRLQDKEIIQSRKSQIYDAKINTKNGVCDYETIKTPFYDENGNVAGVIGIARDVTDRKKMINIIEDQNNFLKQMLNATTDLIFYKDILGKYLGCNKAFAELYIGLKEKNIVGKRDVDLIKDTSLSELVIKRDREVLEAKEPRIFEEKLNMIDGRIVDVETLKTPFYDNSGKVAGLIGVARDISSRKAIEEKMRVSEEKFRLLLKI